jgi:hypothetical protein
MESQSGQGFEKEVKERLYFTGTIAKKKYET